MLTSASRVLGTPDEQNWPDVTSFPDYKASFPKWIRDPSRTLAEGLDSNGQDLLERMLVYDPASRISAKQAIQHPYFDPSGNDRGNRANGYR